MVASPFFNGDLMARRNELLDRVRCRCNPGFPITAFFENGDFHLVRYSSMAPIFSTMREFVHSEKGAR